MRAAAGGSGPRVSICIPTYRGATTIGRTIESVLAQSFTDFELLVVDDHSPDDTAAIVARYADPRLRYHRQPRNLGPRGNWNRCLDLARGRYFKLLPHDDLLHPDCLSQQVQVLDADTAGALALVFCARDVIGPDGRVLLRRRGWPGRAAGPATRADILRACLRAGTNVVGEPGAVLCRLDAARRAGGFDDRYPYVIDLDYWVRLLAAGAGHYQDQALAAFRVWSGSWSVAIGARQSEQFRDFMTHALDQAALRPGPIDRLRGRWMPTVNNLGRRVFYRFVAGLPA